MDRTLPVFDFSMPGSAQVNAADYAWNMPPKISELEFNEAIGLSNLATNPASTQSSYDAWSLPSFEGTHQNSLAQFEALWKPGRPIGHSINRPEVQASAQPLPLANFADTPSLAPVDSGLDASNPDSGGSKRPGSPMQNARSCERADSSEKAKAINRESQRRFRLRQKARSQAVEHQLASTTAELRELKQRQHQLEVQGLLHVLYFCLAYCADSIKPNSGEKYVVREGLTNQQEEQRFPRLSRGKLSCPVMLTIAMLACTCCHEHMFCHDF